MPLLNYTTKVPVAKSVQEIEKALVKAGAVAVMHDYDDEGQVSAVSFRIVLQGNMINFRLPIDTKAVAEILRSQRVYRDDAHAQRVAWRIVKDWVEAQMALLATKSVSLPQLFLPYAVDNKGTTLYEKIAMNPSLLLGDGER